MSNLFHFPFSNDHIWKKKTILLFTISCRFNRYAACVKENSCSYPAQQRYAEWTFTKQTSALSWERMSRIMEINRNNKLCWWFSWTFPSSYNDSVILTFKWYITCTDQNMSFKTFNSIRLCIIIIERVHIKWEKILKWMISTSLY